MEPLESPLKHRIVFHAPIVSLEEKTDQMYVSGVGKDAVFKPIPGGWFMQLEGSYEALFIGMEKPKVCVGDIVTVIFELPR